MNNDITTLLCNIKENIDRMENEQVDMSEKIKADFRDLLEYIKLFLISERDSYYGYFFMNMVLEMDFETESIAGIKLNSFPPVFMTNPLILCKYSVKEIIFIVCHEIEHIIFNHPTEMIKVNPTNDNDIFYKFNLAADASVNDRLIYEIANMETPFMSFPEGCIDSKKIGEIFDIKHIRKNENYQYYYNLIKDKEIDNEDESMSSNVVLGEHEWDVGDDVADAQAIVRELINASVDIMSQETRGLMSADFLSKVEEINKPPVISWESILKKYVGTITAGKRKTRSRLNRRQPQRFDLSGTVDDKTLKIVVAIDTSASVTDEDMSNIFNEIFAILARRKYEMTVIECDSEVNRVYQARNRSEIKKSVTGRGGTLFSPVIEYINENKYFRDALLIYFTDGFGEAVIPKPMTYRNLWVVLGNEKYLSVEEPYGAVVKL